MIQKSDDRSPNYNWQVRFQTRTIYKKLKIIKKALNNCLWYKNFTHIEKIDLC